MKRSLKTIAGVTLLEIMLVLAIAAMVIVMSIRYYQSATYSQQTNQVMGQIEAITAAMDQLSQGAGSYVGITPTQLEAVVGVSNMTTAQNQLIGLTASTITTYTIQIPALPAAVCTSLLAKLSANYNITKPVCDTATGNLTYTYDVTAVAPKPAT